MAAPPTLLPPADLERILDAIPRRPDAEVTIEANPESVDPSSLAKLRDAGFTRISLGMQSAVPSVLATLNRQHSPGRAVEAAHEARAAGFDQISMDLIYGAPGETAEDWEASLAAAISANPTHVSTYSLVVEPGTLLAKQVRRGEVRMPGEDVVVDRFETADRTLAAAGLHWYETCSWAVDEDAHCRHNLGYWSGGNWWGAGPGAHSHVGGVRWWNALHPRTWAAHVQGRRVTGRRTGDPDDDAARLERVMLGLRLAAGVPLDDLSDAGREAARRHVDDGLIERDHHAAGRVVLTRTGRLLADPVTLALAA
ncbi:radical SAM protein [Svornostia abyssi]|uniref:Heme chaperone HemW n=1 Tax=Svornostia abyssi TaxID=2898438 RepID=A0ABY5PKI0_9ACTN|nr:radical SAM protein [Parviterribacteraceae bacterium J379]